MRVSTIITAIACIMIAGCSSTGSDHVTPTTAPTPTSGASVIGRAPSPTQTDAPGIQFTAGALEVTVHNHAVQIAAKDWNTITDTSVVPRDIGVSLDSDFHASQTTRNRFQYLADRMFPFVTHSFGAVGIVSVVKGGNDITIVALMNPTANAFQLTGFSVTISESPPETEISSAKFYSTPDTALTIPGDNIYFVRLTSPAAARPPASATSTSYDFSWDRLYNCGQAACP